MSNKEVIAVKTRYERLQKAAGIRHFQELQRKNEEIERLKAEVVEQKAEADHWRKLRCMELDDDDEAEVSP